MTKINKYLSEWEREGLVSSSQAQKILDYENNKYKKPWILYGFIMLGVVILSIGIISLIAANWSDIPPAVKLAIDLLILIGVAFAIYKISGKDKPMIFDGLAALFVFLYLASIGLVSQIYHTGGQIYEALFLLAVVSLPITLLSFKKFLPNVWAVICLLTLILFCAINLDRYEDSNSYFTLIGILFSLPFICAVPGNLSIFSKATSKLSMPFIFWSVVFFFAGVFFFDFTHSIDSYFHNNMFYQSEKISTAPYYLIINISFILTIVLLWFNKNIIKKVKILSCILSFIYCLFMNFFMFFDKFAYEYYKAHNSSSEIREWYYSILKFSGPVETILALLLFSFIFSSLNMKKLFNFMILLIGIRFLVIYFQVFGSLAYTGFGLIISGLLIIGVVILWYKYSSKIEKTLRGIIQ
jgi:uncharacterized membrane protein